MSYGNTGRHGAALTVLLVLAGCAAPSVGPSPTTAAAGPAPAGFACPVSGTRVTFRSGGSITYRGADPADPAVCIVSTSSNPAQRRLLNYWQLPNEAEQSVRIGLAALWPLEPGRTTTYSRIQSFRTGGSAVMQDTWRVERSERVTAAGAPRDVLVITRTIQGNNNHMSRDTLRYGPAWRMFVSSSSELISGSSPNPPFEVTEVSSP